MAEEATADDGGGSRRRRPLMRPDSLAALDLDAMADRIIDALSA
jgi:hypothetical protein